MDWTNSESRPCSAHILISQLPFIDRQSKTLRLHTRNQMPNWLRSRWSCWSSSLLSNSMLSREWWDVDRPIWRRLLSSNSRCSACISASLRRLSERHKSERHESKVVTLKAAPLHVCNQGYDSRCKRCGCTLWQPPRCTPAPLPRTPVCWWEGVTSGTDGSPPQPPPHCCVGWHGNAYSSGPGGCHDAHSSQLRSRWPQPSEHESYSSAKPRKRSKCGRINIFLWDVSNKIKGQIC